MFSSLSAMRILGVLVLGIAISGCATIVGDKRQNVSINSSPDEAEVTIKNQGGTVVERGETPMTITLDKSAGYFDGEEYTLEFKKEGYQSKMMTISAHPNGWYLAGNLLFGGLIGWFIVDPATGAMWTLSPDELEAELGDAENQASGSHIRVVLLEDVPEKLRDDMEKVASP